jgi:hypothetical protein
MRNRWSMVMRCLVFSLALGLLASAAPSARADGMAFKARDMSSYIPVREREQVAVIEHDGVEETLTIAINIAEAEDDSGLSYDESAVWIFPVRGQPDDITIDIKGSLPELRGTRLESAVSAGVTRLFAPTYVTQVYPAIAFCLLPALGRARGLSATTLHNEIEKYGLRCQLVTAENLGDLGDWLEAQGTPIPLEHLASFETYMNSEHALVVVSIASSDKIAANFPEAAVGGRLKERWPCVRVTFPTAEAFYPMIPTSGYELEVIAYRLYVKGFVDIAQPISYGDGLRLRHVLADTPDSNASGSFGDYTVIRGQAMSEDLKEDLTFQPCESLRLSSQVLFARLSAWPLCLLWSALLTALLSYVSAALAGQAVLGDWRASARLGLWNLLTLIVFYIAVRDSSLAKRVATPDSRWRGSPAKFADSMTGTFTLIFLLLSLLTHVVVAGTLGTSI